MSHEEFMERAIELSKRGLGRTFPNPIVGAVIVSNTGEIIGEGFHAGGDHAEVAALSSAAKNSKNVKGATIYVTLEPCNHVGKTPPCTQTLIDAGISRVVYAVKDPNPVAQGGGEFLSAAGVEVISGVLNDQALEPNRAWHHKIVTGRPFIIWKIATTLDGYSAAEDGTSKWITSEESRVAVQQFRAESDAIVIGTGTALSDNPSLVPRNDERRPVRIVVGLRSIPSDFKLYDQEAQTIFLPSRDNKVLIDTLNELKVNQVLIESGATLGSSLLRENLIDELWWYQAPTILGSGIKAISNLQVTTLSHRIDYTIVSVERSGADICTVLRPIARRKAEALS